MELARSYGISQRQTAFKLLETCSNYHTVRESVDHYDNDITYLSCLYGIVETLENELKRYKTFFNGKHIKLLFNFFFNILLYNLDSMSNQSKFT